MADLKNIIWLSSYPKSGNTWIRIFLENIRAANEHPVDINNLSLSKIASSRILFDRFSGVNSSDLTIDEIDRFRPQVYRMLAEEVKDDVLLKVHDGWRLNADQEALFPHDVTKAVIYILRNPLDIVVSSAFHNSTDYHTSVERINTAHVLCKENDRLYNQLRQELYSWSNHVISWIDQSELPLITIRYEDLIQDPVQHFSSVLKFIKWDYSKKKILRAVKNSEISILQEQEQKIGFREKPLRSESFFRSGKIGSWKERLDVELVRRVYQMNRKVMDRFGYSDKNLDSF